MYINPLFYPSSDSFLSQSKVKASISYWVY